MGVGRHHQNRIWKKCDPQCIAQTYAAPGFPTGLFTYTVQAGRPDAYTSPELTRTHPGRCRQRGLLHPLMQTDVSMRRVVDEVQHTLARALRMFYIRRMGYGETAPRNDSIQSFHARDATGRHLRQL